MTRQPRGFTLIELLVVIAILAVLAAILFPVFAQAREKARQSDCLAHYHQIGQAIHLYASDYDSKTPPDGGSFSGLITDCQPYIKNSTIFICPDDYDRATEKRAGSYRIPSLYQGLDIVCGWPNPYAAGKTTKPATTTLLYEAEQDFTQSVITPTYRHQGGTQVLYFDGHTKWIKSEGPKDDDD